MKDTEIHKSLENKEIRDFLAKSIVDAELCRFIEPTPRQEH